MLLYGHRGARAEAPENTLAGFRHLRSLGIHRVELDLRLSKDQQLVVLHDKTVERTMLKQPKFKQQSAASQFTTKQLAKMKAKQSASNFKDGLGVPTIREVIAEWPELESIQLEVKPARRSDLPIIADQLAQLIADYSLEKTAIITSSHQGFLAVSKRVNQKISHGLVADKFTYNPVGKCKRLRCDYLIANWKIVNQRLVRKAHQNNLTISSWTVNHLPIAKDLRDLGIHSLISDVPKQMRYICDR